jgi:hypothetical protein
MFLVVAFAEGSPKCESPSDQALSATRPLKGLNNRLFAAAMILSTQNPFTETKIKPKW